MLNHETFFTEKQLALEITTVKTTRMEKLFDMLQDRVSPVEATKRLHFNIRPTYEIKWRKEWPTKVRQRTKRIGGGGTKSVP